MYLYALEKSFTSSASITFVYIIGNKALIKSVRREDSYLEMSEKLSDSFGNLINIYLNNFLLLKYYLARKDLLESFHTSCFLPLMNFSVGSIIVENQSSSSTLRNKLLH